MSAVVKSTAEFRSDDEREPLRVTDDLRDWIEDLPEGAVLIPITHDIGNQRDPWPILVGLRATWEATQ